jgi:cell wall-associated NlpC family hydrolase
MISLHSFSEIKSIDLHLSHSVSLSNSSLPHFEQYFIINLLNLYNSNIYRLLYHSTIFRTIDENATGNANKYGIRNSSYADIANAYNVGGIKGVGNSLSSFITSKDLDNIKEFNKLVSEEGVSSQTAWYKIMQTSSSAAKELFDNEENLIKSGNSVILSEEAISNATNTMTFSAKTGQVALKGLALAGNMVVGILAGFVISKAIEGLDNLVHAADNAKESAEGFASSFSSMNDEFSSNDSKLSDLQKQYDELSKGVNSLGENVSLTTDQYDEYKQVVSEISDMMPSLLARYDDEGNKIGFVQGKLSNLNAEYDKYKKNKAMDLVNGENDNGDSIKDVFDNYQYQTAHTDTNGNVVGKRKMFGDSSYEKILALQSEIDSGYDGIFGQNKLTNEDIEKKTALIQKYQSEIDASVSAIQDALSAIAQSGDEYYKLSDQEQQFLDTYINSLSQDFIDENNLTNETNARTFINNLINDIESGKPEIMKAYNDLFSFNIDDTDLSPEEVQKKVNELIQQLAKALGEDNWQDLKIRLGFEFVDDNVKDYEDTINRFNDPDKIKAFFNEEGINTASEVKEFYDVYSATDKAKQGIYDADVAMQEWKNHITENTASATASLTSFEEAWMNLKGADDSDLKGAADDLLDLANAGQLTENSIEELAGGQKLMSDTGLSAEELAQKINGLVNASTQLSSMSAQISKMSDMLADKKNGTVASASDLAGFDVSVRGLESWDKFEEVMGSSESSMDQCQKAANALATEWVNDGNFLANLTDENKQYYITQLEDMGVKNAEQIVTEALTKKEEELRFEKLLSADASTDLQNATVADILKLQNLGDITEQEKAKLAAFTLEKQYCNKNTIVTDADCQNIYTLAKMAGAGTEALNKLAALKQRLSDNPIMSNEMRNNINSAIQGIVNGVTTSAGAKLDIPQVKVNSSGSSSYKSPSSKKSKSKTKSDAAEVFDFIEIKLNNLADKASKAKDKIDDLLTFGQKKNQTKKAIEATTKAITAQEKAYKKYMAYANKAAKTQNSKKTTSSSSSSSGGNALYDEATNYLGLKYVWGGASLTKGADCSGFTQQIYKKFGVSLPHKASYQAKMGTKITSKSDLQAGDLVFFGSKNNITHVGIYGGDGKFIESPHTGASVRVSKLSSRKDFVSGSRFSGISGSTKTSGKNVKKVKGVSSKTLEHYKRLIREGTLGSDGIASIKNENLKNALKDYQTYYEKAKACKEQVASLTDQLKDLYETLANNPIDNASDKIEKLGTKMDILNAKVGNLTFNPTKKIGTSDIDSLYKQIIKNYNSQLSASKTAYTGATKSYNSNKSSLTKSLKKTKAKNIGLTQKEFNSIKSNLKSNKSISYNLINKIENDTLREKCIAHNEYLLAKNTATDNYNQAKEDHTSNVRQARKDRFDKVQERYDNKAGLIEQKKNAVSNSLSIAEAKGQLIGEAYYTRQANAVKSDMKLKQEEAGKLAKKLSTIKFGSDEWYEAQEALNGVYESIQQDEQELAEFQKSINELKFDRFDELLNKLGDITDETDFLIDMLDSDNLFDSDTGMITDDGITAIGLTAQNYDTYLAEAQKYKDAIADLNEMYKNGEISLTDYNSQLRTYQQGQRDSIKSANEAKKSLVAYVKQGLDAQNDALSDAIDKKKKLLETEKDLHDFQSKIADQNKNIAKIEKQIAALESDDSEENRKKLQQLKSNLQDAQKDREDTLYDRSISDQEDSLDKMLENSKKQAEDYLKDTNKVFSDALTYVNANSSQVASNIEKIAKDTGYDISSYIVNAWKDGGSAVGDYASTLSSNIPNITAQLSLIASSWQSICDAADRAAEASAKYAETKVTDTQGIGSPNDSGTSGNGSGSSGSNDADKQQELYELRKKASDITEWISKHSVSATHKKSYYGALNQYLYDKQHGQVLSKANEVALAKKLGVSVKSDLSGKNDREKITSALKKLIKDASFSTGGVIKDLVKLSGEDGISFLQRGKAVLSKEQTQALLNFKPVIPQINSIIGNLKNIPEKVSSQSPTYQIDNRTIVEGVATDQIVKQMEGVAQKQAENVVRKINQATYAKGVRK